jgi:predicted RNase H-like HicB family nuclease
MTRNFTAIIEREDAGASQGASVSEARGALQEAIELFFETASPTEIDRRLRGEVYVTQIEAAVA